MSRLLLSRPSQAQLSWVVPLLQAVGWVLLIVLAVGPAGVLVGNIVLRATPGGLGAWRPEEAGLVVLNAETIFIALGFSVVALYLAGAAALGRQLARTINRFGLLATLLLCISAYSATIIVVVRPASTVGLDAPAHALFLVLFIFLAPLAEELFFRGWLWDRLEEGSGERTAAMLTGVFWAATHVVHGPSRVLLLAPVALGLSVARARCRSLSAPLLLHVTNNAVGYVMADLLMT